MLIPNSIMLAVGIGNTSPANTILATTAAVSRYIRGITVTNTTGAAITVTCGIGAAAATSAANSDVASGTSIPANAASFQLVQYPGVGKKALGSVGNAVFAVASGAGLLMNVVYADDVL